MLLKIKIILILISFVLVQNGEAQLRCLSLFPGDKQTYAKVIDSLNTDTNNNIFKADFEKILNPDFEGKNLWQQFQLRKQAFSVGRKLKELKKASNWSSYDFEIFSRKLEKISYLTDASILKNMSETEKVIYLQARHSALSKGLESFFFEGTHTPTKVRSLAFKIIMYPFQRVVARWIIAPVNMPKLHGSVITAEDAIALLWEGPQKRPDIVEKYSLTFSDKPIHFYLNIFSSAQAKHYFNSFSTVYNYGILATALGLLPIYGYLTFTEVQEKGVGQAVEMYTPGLESSEKAAAVNYKQLADDLELRHTIENFKAKRQREPTDAEIIRIKALLLTKKSASK